MSVLCRSRTNSFTACSSTVDAPRSFFTAFWRPSLRESSMSLASLHTPLFRRFSPQMKVVAGGRQIASGQHMSPCGRIRNSSNDLNSFQSTFSYRLDAENHSKTSADIPEDGARAEDPSSHSFLLGFIADEYGC